MSMNATFVQIDAAELSRLQADPSLAEALFQDGPAMPPAFANLAKTVQERMRAAGPQAMAEKLAQLDPRLRQQIEESLRRTTSAMAAGGSGVDLLKMMQERAARRGGLAPTTSRGAVLSLDKSWHGVHYVLCGEVEPGASLLSQAVMGGVELRDPDSDDGDEGFSGYGPARYFTAAQVAEISQALNRPEVESEAAARFDADRMSQLDIYPGWRPSDAEEVLGAFRRLRDFYSDAAGKGRAIVTCLV